MVLFMELAYVNRTEIAYWDRSGLEENFEKAAQIRTLPRGPAAPFTQPKYQLIVRYSLDAQCGTALAYDAMRYSVLTQCGTALAYDAMRSYSLHLAPTITPYAPTATLPYAPTITPYAPTATLPYAPTITPYTPATTFPL
eukprot:3609255-Rhodomonas_salina.1